MQEFTDQNWVVSHIISAALTKGGTANESERALESASLVSTLHQTASLEFC